MTYVKNNLIDSLNDGMAYGEVTAVSAAVVGLLGVTGVGILLGALTGAVMLAGVLIVQAAFTSEVWAAYQCILFCNMEDDASFTVAGWNAVRASINSNFIGVVNVILGTWVTSVGNIGLTNSVRTGIAEDSDCSDCACAPPCESADSFYNGIVNSITDNGDGTITFNVTSQPAPGVDGTQYIGWGDRENPASACCVFKHQSCFELGPLGGARQACGSATEEPNPPDENGCYHFWLFYNNFDLTTPFTCDVTMGSGCP
jgi:hypothetical protein